MSSRPSWRRYHNERPLRLAHARKGPGAYGTFTVTGDIPACTNAALFSEAGKQTETFVRFSTAAGDRGVEAMTPIGFLDTVSVGRARQMSVRGRVIDSAIAKSATAEAVWVGRLGLTGDEHGERVHHGGPDKAVLAYPSEHYTAWADQLGRPERPAFGENLTTTGLLEHQVVLGTVYRIGTAVLQATQPRQPCYKLAAFHEQPDLAVRTQQTGRTGIYFRVLQSGTVRAGDVITLVAQPNHGITAAEVHRVLNIDRADRMAARRLLAHPNVLPARWQRALQKRLAGDLDDHTERLYGAP